MISPKQFFGSIIVLLLLNGACQPKDPDGSIDTQRAGNTSASPNFVQAASKAIPAVVHISVEHADNPPSSGHVISPVPRTSGRRSTGSGVIITPNGYIVTNHHVTAHAKQITVSLEDGNQYNAQLKGKDPHTDLALLKIQVEGLPYLEFGNSDVLQIGEWVLAVGSPYNLHGTVTKGIVSTRRRYFRESAEANPYIKPFIQHDAVTSPGSSGGALVNLAGELVGVTTAAIRGSIGDFTGHSFAVPASVVQQVFKDLQQHGTVQRGVVGVCIKNITEEEAHNAGLKGRLGVRIDKVWPNGAAAEANMQVGDIVTAIDGHKVEHVPQFLAPIVLRKPGEHVLIDLYRGGVEYRAHVTLKRMTD